MRILQIRDQTSGATIASRAELCNSPWLRFRGLMLRASLPEGRGILLSPCNSVHMAMMRFAIDVIYLDRQMRHLRSGATFMCQRHLGRCRYVRREGDDPPLIHNGNQAQHVFIEHAAAVGLRRRKVRDKKVRHEMVCRRALEAFAGWMSAERVAI